MSDDTVIQRRGFIFVLSSPSGAGKTTITRRLMQEDAGGLVMSVSVTTRPRRVGETDGVDYFFVSESQFDSMIAEGELLEHAEVFGNRYGTPRHYVEQAQQRGVDVLFDIDWQGTRQLAEHKRNDLVSVFILPPSMQELERRLHTRARDSESEVKKRMAKATAEISHWNEYDYVVVNNDLDQTLARVSAILHAERRRRVRQEEGLRQFVERLCRPA